MLRTVRVEVESGAGVARQQAARRRAWFHRTPGSSRVSVAGPWKAMRQEGGAFPVGEEAEVADAHEAAREQVQEEAAQELVDRQSQKPLFCWHVRSLASGR